MEIHDIDCGKSHIQLEIFDSGPPIIPGPTVVVTAGMDGDEYVGIEAAQSLVKAFCRRKPLNGRVVIIPCVNMPGFTSKTSKNPLDGKYPKHLFPGNPKGTETERLISWIASHYIYGADYWIDLHGGATQEALAPFVWGYELDDISMNEKTRRILEATNAPIIVYQKNFQWEKVVKLGHAHCSYVIFECGQKGNTDRNSVRIMESWAFRSFGALGVMEKQRKSKRQSLWASEVHEYISSYDEWVWNPEISAGEDVKKGQLLGELQKNRCDKKIPVRARQDGKILWNMLQCVTSKHDVVAAICTGSVLDMHS